MALICFTLIEFCCSRNSFDNLDLSTQTLIPVVTGFKIAGNAVGNNLGGSVSTAGDINNDGYDDIVVAAYGKNTVYVIYGGKESSFLDLDLSTTSLSPPTTGFMITGNAANDQFGFSVSTAGDINKDGYDDIIVGAPQKNSNAGAAYVIYGGEKLTMSNIVLSSTTLNPSMTGFMITGNAADDWFGVSVSTAGDINKDGYDDIIVGAHGKNSYQGAAYVIYGGDKSTMSNIDLSSTTLNPSTTGFMITGNAADDWFGVSVSIAGDINKDGYDDIIVGAPYKNGRQGAAYVIYGGPKSSISNWDFSSGATLDPSKTGFMITGKAAADWFGRSVSTAGDINNDGYDDIIVGAPYKNNYQGEAYVIYASCSKNCMQCSSESVCTTCKSSYLMMYQSKCFASCPDGTLATSPTTCDDCPAHCNHCSSTSVCTECKNSYILYQSQCLDSCPDGMFLSTTTCEDCLTPCSLCSDLYRCSECTSPFVLYKSQCFTSCPNAMFDSNNVCKDCPIGCSSCSSQTSCTSCYQGYSLSNSLCVLSRAQEKASQAIASATQGIGSVVCVGSAVFPFSALVSKIIQNTRYLNLSVTSELSEVYQTWQTDLISWDVPNVMSDLDHFKTSPPLFAQYDLGSPFLVNFWPTLLNIGIGFGTFVACILLEKLFESAKYEGWVRSLVQKLVAGSFNFALVQAYACLDDILFYLVLDAKTNPFNSPFSWTSIICAVIFLGLGCLLVFFNFWTVKKYQNIKHKGMKEIEAFNERNKYWELFYSDFSDDDLWSQSFFAIAIVRSSLSSFIIAVLYDYPLMQTSYLVTLDGAIILFLYFQNPFNTLRGKLAQYYYETITSLIHLCTFILSLQDSFKSSSYAVKVIMSTGILYLNTALVSGAIGFMFIEIYETIRSKNKALKRKQYENIAIQTATGDILTTNQDQDLKTLDTYVDHQQASISYESFHLLRGVNQNSNLDSSGLNLLESNFNADNSRELEMYPRKKKIKQRDQRTAQILNRPHPRRLRQGEPKKISVRPKNARHPARFGNE